MATPRIFVSSTCYDLQEIRFQLRYFINEFGYDAVMSDFDDIFYSYETHVQDSCLEEISKCQLFILVVGNNYGSFYHQDKQETKIPDSVTLKEFRKALEVKIYKHIFINKYVDYDYKNYKRALEKETLIYFQKNDVKNEDIEEAKNTIKIKFDSNYHFPYDSYKYVFYFIDIIYDLKENNAINTFESFADVKDNLKKQWAGFMYESLTRKDKVANALIQPLETKLDKIDKNITKLFESKTVDNNKLSFDLNSLIRETNIENLEEIKDKIQELLLDIRCYEHWYDEGISNEKRVYFNKKFTAKTVKDWLDSLKILIQSFKWSKQIHSEKVFENFNLSKYNKWNNEISYKSLFELYTIYNGLNKDDKNGFYNTVALEFNKNFDEQKPPTSKREEPDDLPF
jgi:hypothetical protein